MKILKYLGLIISSIVVIVILKALNCYDFISFVAGEIYMFLCVLIGIEIYESK